CANAFRVIGTGFLAQYWGARAAEGFFHEFAGMAVFVVAIALLVSLGAWLNGCDRRSP
ncbi:MAG TPA: archaeosortase/exosortase family protein, partial [Geomonas sp.]